MISEIYSKGPKRNYNTNKTDVYHIDDIRSLDILNLKRYGPENNRGYRYVLFIIDNFSKIGCTVPLKNAKTITNSLENILINSRRKPNLIESDGRKELNNNISQDILNKNNIKIYSRITSLGAVFAERFINKEIFFKKPVFEKCDVWW